MGQMTASGARKKVLIVDDEYLIRYSTQRLVELEGYAAYTAECGMAALALFYVQKPDIVILDLRLPDSDGLELLRTIKAARPSVSVIMATGCPDSRSRLAAIRLGALAYMEKPIDIDALKYLMREAGPDLPATP